jgi:chaperone BCS1
VFQLCFRWRMLLTNYSEGREGCQRGNIISLSIVRSPDCKPILQQEEKEAKEKSDKKERAKAKKAHRAEAAMKLEGASSSTASLTTTEPVIPVVVLSASESSSSESDSSNGGVEADTEESITSEEEPDKTADGPASGDSAVKDNSHSKEKWVAVKADS